MSFVQAEWVHMHTQCIAEDINTLAKFLGRRDLDELSQAAVLRLTRAPQVDVFVLFGGSILAGGDVLAQAIYAQLAKCYVIVGGAGHTTQTFRARVHHLCPNLQFADDATEAEIFEAYLKKQHGLKADLLETRSTNCGNNVTFLRDLLLEQRIACQKMIISQDLTMQLRMAAICAKEMPEVEVISYASYQVEVVPTDAGDDVTEAIVGLNFAKQPLGMWSMRRYLSLLMGEIPRLRDDENGYGPQGKDFLAHVDIPAEVEAAFARLAKEFPGSIRKASTSYACPQES